MSFISFITTKSFIFYFYNLLLNITFLVIITSHDLGLIKYINHCQKLLIEFNLNLKVKTMNIKINDITSKIIGEEITTNGEIIKINHLSLQL